MFSRFAFAALDKVRASRRPLSRSQKRGKWIVIASSAFGLITGTLAIDAANPPDMTRYVNVSPEVVDHDGKLLRPFLTKDGFWRLKTNVRDVSPRYLALLKGYEDHHYDSHFGIDFVAVARAAKQYFGAGAHVVSGASTLTMQTARLLEGPRPRSLLNKLFQMVRAVQLEERYS